MGKGGRGGGGGRGRGGGGGGGGGVTLIWPHVWELQIYLSKQPIGPDRGDSDGGGIFGAKGGRRRRGRGSR